MTKLTDQKKEDNLIQAVIQETDEIFFTLLENYPKKDKNDCRQQTFLHSMMFNCMVSLYDNDYTIKDIIHEAFSALEIYEKHIKESDEDSDED
jgi:hypothetical protein